VRSHVKQIFRKLDVHTRSQATGLALRSPEFRRR
jgi:DNA-binding CsgD family transcriptional regulator